MTGTGLLLPFLSSYFALMCLKIFCPAVAEYYALLAVFLLIFAKSIAEKLVPNIKSLSYVLSLLQKCFKMY